MKPQQTIPLIAGLTPIAAAAPPLLVFAGIGLALYWLFSDDKKEKPDAPVGAEKSGVAEPAPVPTTFFHDPPQQREVRAVSRPTVTPAPAPVKYALPPVPAPQKPSAPKAAAAITPISHATPQAAAVPPSNSAKTPVSAAEPPRMPEAKKDSLKSSAFARRVTREDLAEALAYGAKSLSRKEAVAALEVLGFRKTSAYKALSPEGKFANLIEVTSDGLIEWRG